MSVQKPVTIGELRAYLDNLEANWDDQDDLYLGQFDDQPLYAVHPNGGIDRAFYQYNGELGLIAFPLSR